MRTKPGYFLAAFFLAPNTVAMADFVDATVDAGITHVGESYGAAWGDYNGDGLPDLWVSNHADTPNLYLNGGDGTFTDIAMQVWPGRLYPPDEPCWDTAPGVCLTDTHGAAWADFDNDGDQDLLEVVGGARGNHLFLNNPTELVEVAAIWDVASLAARSRSPGWFDWNNDGLLDVVLTHALNATNYPLLMTQQPSLFVDDSSATGIGEPTTSSVFLADIVGDDRAELILSRGYRNNGPVYATGALPFTNVSSSLTIPGAYLGCADSVFADFNGDQRVDVFSICSGGGREVVQRSDQRVELRMELSGAEHAIEFDLSQPVSISVFPSFLFELEEHLHVGAGAIIPPITEHPELGWRSFTVDLDPQMVSTQGEPPHVPGGDTGIFIGVDPATQRWRLALSAAQNASASIVVTTAGVISDLATLGFNAVPFAPDAIYLERADGGFTDRRVSGGFSDPQPCNSVVGGDFDNDTDVDLYLVCSNIITNLPNRLMLNDGNGNFAPAPGDSAAGSLVGSGESVVTADYDGDGFLDLFVTNGGGGAPFNLGPQQLFRNVPNTNHWLEIDLEGSTSSRDAVGTVIRIEADGVAQVRMQDGGYHRRSQNHQRIHFGLGASQSVDVLRVIWPSGYHTVLMNVNADQVLPIREADYVDVDSDGIDAASDNCLLIANPDQFDNNGDGYGNACDPDLNNDGTVNVVDLGLLRLAFFEVGDLDADFNGDGVVNAIDLGIMKSVFFLAPGPSAIAY